MKPDEMAETSFRSLKGSNNWVVIAPFQGANNIGDLFVGFRSFLAPPYAIAFVAFRDILAISGRLIP